MKMASLLLLCALTAEGLCIVRRCISRSPQSDSGCNAITKTLVRRFAAVLVYLVLMGFAVVSLMSYIHDMARFRDVAVQVGMSVMTERSGHVPSEVKWSECIKWIRLAPSNGECANGCACILLKREPFGVFVR